MKYYIDFEATQYTHEIISVGCVREDGETFKSYVKVKRSHMSNFITRLTGITKNDISSAPTSDEVFNKFYYWIEKDKNPIFYCYGNADTSFIQANLDRTQDRLAITALRTIKNHLIDYSQVVKEYFGLCKMIALKHLISYYHEGENIEQEHDALSDSLYLKEVFDHISTEPANLDAFPDYKNIPPNKSSLTEDPHEEDKIDIGLVRYDEAYQSYWHAGNLHAAIKKCIRYKKKKHEYTELELHGMYYSIKADILKSIENNTKCCGYYWFIE